MEAIIVGPWLFVLIIREFKIRRLRTTTTVKHATAHDQNHVIIHFFRVVLRLRWVVELFRVVGTTENILLVFCRLGNSRISSFRKKSFQSTCFKREGSEIGKLCLISDFCLGSFRWIGKKNVLAMSSEFKNDLLNLQKYFIVGEASPSSTKVAEEMRNKYQKKLDRLSSCDWEVLNTLTGDEWSAALILYQLRIIQKD